MPENNKTLIMKFGGKALHNPHCFSDVAQLIINRSYEFGRILIVVSAMGEMTEQLIQLAHQVHPTPPCREYDMLLSAGERISIALLAMALSSKGYEAVSFTGSQSGIITSSHHAEAKIIDVRPFRIIPHLDAKKFVIVAGFQGVSHEKEITTLGRGGSDTTAVALGIALRAEKVEFYKDVAGIFEKDPQFFEEGAPLRSLNYQEALNIVNQTGGRILHPRALELAEKNRLLLHVRPFKDITQEGTWIGSENSQPIELYYENSLSPN